MCLRVRTARAGAEWSFTSTQREGEVLTFPLHLRTRVSAVIYKQTSSAGTQRGTKSPTWLPSGAPLSLVGSGRKEPSRRNHREFRKACLDAVVT